MLFARRRRSRLSVARSGSRPRRIWWADLAEARGSEPGYRRPVVIVQNNTLNRSTLRTVVCVGLTSNLNWVDAPGNVLLPARQTGLLRDSVANVSQIITLDRFELVEPVGLLPPQSLDLILAGVALLIRRE